VVVTRGRSTMDLDRHAIASLIAQHALAAEPLRGMNDA